jgi:RNA polymerase sigma-70 factor (ECF subfamily)
MAKTGGVMSKNEELELCRGVGDGKADCISELYNRHFDGVYSWVLNSLQRNQSAAEEVVQDTFMGALKGAAKFNGHSSIRTWLLGIANKKVVDYLRKNGKIQKNEIALDMEALNPERNGPNALDQSEQNHEMVIVIRGVLDSLPQLYRQVLNLKYVEGLSTVDISNVISRSPRAVEGLLRRAREELKSGLQAAK